MMSTHRERGPVREGLLWWDDKFTLAQDGDELERLWWPLLQREFPEYEELWIKHIVPLTHRIDPAFRSNREGWHSFRSDPNIVEEFEAMAMAQYSTFYFLARAYLIIVCEPHLYVEDGFLFLDLTTKNLRSFLKICKKELGPRLGLNPSPFPDFGRIFNLPFTVEANEYRDVIIHAPKIGKGRTLSRTFLPKRNRLPEIERSWRKVQNLPGGDFVDGRELLRRLLKELTVEIRRNWRGVQAALEPARTTVQYWTCMGLDSNYCIPGKGRSR
jgi:hypothetical protein